MISIDKRISSLIDKLFSDKISEDELKELNEWDDSFDEDREIEIINTDSEDMKEVGELLIKRINVRRQTKSNVFEYMKQYRNVAAVIIFVSILLASVGIYITSNSQEQQITWNEIHVNIGQKKILTFSDSSKVILNAGTHFKYPSILDKNNTEVFLDGEAYFEITPDKTRKFIVHTAKLSTSVLGTKFNVSAFKEENETSVSLVEGKVAVSNTGNSNDSVVLNPSEQYVLSKNGSKGIVKQFDIIENIGWKDNQLVFNKKPLGYILNVLSRSCGVSFELSSNNFEEQNFTASFKNTSLSTVIKSIQKLTNLNYNIKEDDNVKRIVFY